MSLADPRVLVPRAERWGRMVVWLCSEFVCQQLFGILLLLVVSVLAEELSPAMASSLVRGLPEQGLIFYNSLM